MAAARQAALVVIVLHVNLLIGDTTALQQIAHGTSSAAGKSGPACCSSSIAATNSARTRSTRPMNTSTDATANARNSQQL